MDPLELIYIYYYHNGSTNMIAKQIFNMLTVCFVLSVLCVSIHIRIDTLESRLYLTEIMSGWVGVLMSICILVIGYQAIYCLWLHNQYKGIKVLFKETLGIDGDSTFQRYVESVCQYYNVTEDDFRKRVMRNRNKMINLIKADIVHIYDGWVYKELFNRCMTDVFESSDASPHSRKCMVYGLTALLLSPVLLIGSLLIKYPSEIATNIYTEGMSFYVGRGWTTNFTVKKRKVLELVHEHEERMQRSSELFSSYIKSSKWGKVVKLEIFVRTLMMLIVTLLIPLFITTFIDDKVKIMGHSVFYVCTILTMSLTMLGKMLPSSSNHPQSDIFAKLCKELDINESESHSLYKKLLSYYPYKGWLLITDVTSPLWAPLYFIFVMPRVIDSGIGFLSSSVYQELLEVNK